MPIDVVYLLENQLILRGFFCYGRLPSAAGCSRLFSFHLSVCIDNDSRVGKKRTREKNENPDRPLCELPPSPKKEGTQQEASVINEVYRESD